MENLILGKQPPLIREAVAMVFGLLFILTGGYSGLEFILGLICAPLFFAGVVRVVVILYRLFILLTHIPLISSGFAIVVFGLAMTAMMKVFQFSTTLGIIVFLTLMVAEALFFIRDVKVYFRHTR